MKATRTRLVAFVATLCVLLTIHYSSAQEPLSNEQFASEGWETWKGTGDWVSDQLSVMFGTEPIVPHPTVKLRGDVLKLYVAYFGMRGCSGCEIMKPRMDELRELGWTVYKFDAQMHRGAVQKLLDPSDRTLPKMVIMNEGQPVQIISGTPSTDSLVEILKKIRDGDADEDMDDEIDEDDSGLDRKIDYDLFG
jgi:hypothetical protein